MGCTEICNEIKVLEASYTACLRESELVLSDTTNPKILSSLLLYKDIISLYYVLYCIRLR